MKPLAAVPLIAVALLCGCTPRAQPQSVAPRTQEAPPVVQAAAVQQQATSYEVSIASAQADRVHARDECDSKPKPARPSCFRAAEAAYDQARSAAEKARDAGE